MSAARLLGLALIAFSASLPALARDGAELRGRFTMDFAQASENGTGESTFMPKVLITESSKQSVLVSKPAVLRYTSEFAPPERLAAERVGQDPDRQPASDTQEERPE